MFTTPGDRVARLRQSYTIGGVARRSPSTVVLRETLTANRTYYVRTDGSDTNLGLVNTSAGAFLTIQKAFNVIAVAIDFAGFGVTVQVADGTYSENVAIVPWVGGGSITVNGNSGTPANVVVSTISATAGSLPGGVVFSNFETQTLNAQKGASFSVFTGMRFNGGGVNIQAGTGAVITLDADYTIAGSALWHYLCDNATITTQGVARTITVSGTPAFSQQFANSSNLGFIYAVGATYSGAATGTRYSAAGNAIINTGGGGANFFPGNAAGSTGTGGHYI